MKPSYQRKQVGICVALLFAAFFLCSSENANGSVSYTYDALGRLVMVSYDTGVCIRYTYDASGNRLSETIIMGAAGSPGVWGCFKWGQALWGP
jgi:hypothetical protein